MRQKKIKNKSKYNENDSDESERDDEMNHQIEEVEGPSYPRENDSDESKRDDEMNHQIEEVEGPSYPRENDSDESQRDNDLIQFGRGAYMSKKTLERSLYEESKDLGFFSISEGEENKYFNEEDFNSPSSSESSDNEDAPDQNEFKSNKFKSKEFKHIKLPIHKVDVDTMETTFLHGKIYFNNENIVYDNKLRQERSKFAKYRKLFKLTGKVLRELNYSDQGQINSEITQEKVEQEKQEKQENNEIIQKGEELIKILKKLLQEEKYNYSTVKQACRPILDWYYQKYKSCSNRKCEENVINDTIKYGIPLINIDLSGSYIDGFDFEKAKENAEKRADEEIDMSEYDEDYEEEEEEEESDENTRRENTNYEDILPKQSKYVQCSENGQDQLKEIMKYNEWKKENSGCDNFDDDDNNTIAECYFWEDRAEILNSKQILSDIRWQACQKKPPLPTTSYTISGLKKEIYREMFQLYVDKKKQFPNISYASFANYYLEKNNNLETMSSLVRTFKTFKNIPLNKSMFNQKTLINKLSLFKSASKYKKSEILSDSNSIPTQGGQRKKLQRVSDDTLLCLITLVLDFPTLSTKSYTAYINSPFGPNSEKKVSWRTIQRYLKKLNFTCKKASFAPPNRNSIGLRIYRYAWCHFIEQIYQSQNTLIGFIDEASVTSCEGRKYGRAYIGLTPVVNCPLNKTKLTVLSLVMPGFGVLYETINGAVDNLRYSRFINETVRFLRRYICNEKTEIVFIEDNCPIHCTQHVEKTIEKLNIALLPIVPYSPSLNGVVEGYFGIIKAALIRLTEETGEEAIIDEIKQNWKEATFQNFNLKTAHALYYEWIVRMKICLQGKPIYSGHIDDSIKADVDYDWLTYITVNRIVEKTD